MPDDRYGGSEVITFVVAVTIKPEHEEEYLAVGRHDAKQADLVPCERAPGSTVGCAGHHAAGDNPRETVDLARDFPAESGW